MIEEPLLERLIETRAFMMSEEPSFRLASGELSKVYVDCRRAFSFPDFVAMVGELVYARLEEDDVTAVGGLMFGAVPVALAVSAAAARRDRLVRAFFVRKDTKEHGLRRLIEGVVERGERVAIVDDVITSGKSTIEAIQKSRTEGLEVVTAAAIVDREEQGGRQAIEKVVPSFGALCTLSQLVDKFREQSRSSA